MLLLEKRKSCLLVLSPFWPLLCLFSSIYSPFYVFVTAVLPVDLSTTTKTSGNTLSGAETTVKDGTCIDCNRL